MNLIGPVSMSEHYSGKFNKHIYIFGDVHLKKPVCQINQPYIDIITFLEQTIDQHKDKLDIFLEVPYKKRNIEYKFNFVDTWLNQIEHKFQNCLLPDKKNCEYQARFHYTDLRAFYFRNFVSYYDIIYNIFIFHNRKDLIEVPKNLQIITTHLNIDPEQLKTTTEDTILNEFGVLNYRYNNVDWDGLERLFQKNNEEIISILKIEKQYTDKDVYNFYKKELYPNLVKTLNSLRENLTFIKSSRDYKLSELRLNFDRLSKFINNINFLTNIFDSYTLGRIFKSYSNKIIIYVGEGHAENFRNILRKFNFTSKEVKSESYGTNFQCINLSSFHLPLFDEKFVEMNMLDRFCGYLSKENYENLPEKYRILFRNMALYCLENNIGEQNRVKRILKLSQ